MCRPSGSLALLSRPSMDCFKLDSSEFQANWNQMLYQVSATFVSQSAAASRKYLTFDVDTRACCCYTVRGCLLTQLKYPHGNFQHYTLSSSHSPCILLSVTTRGDASFFSLPRRPCSSSERAMSSFALFSLGLPSG
jgi:hypothetical protein